MCVSVCFFLLFLKFSFPTRTTHSLSKRIPKKSVQEDNIMTTVIISHSDGKSNIVYNTTKKFKKIHVPLHDRSVQVTIDRNENVVASISLNFDVRSIIHKKVSCFCNSGQKVKDDGGSQPVHYSICLSFFFCVPGAVGYVHFRRKSNTLTNE